MQTAKMKQYGKNAVIILAPLLIGLLVGLLIMQDQQIYETLNRPPLSPPGKAFGIVWPILYLLLGISCYLAYRHYKTTSVSQKEHNLFAAAILLFVLQLLLNYAWSFIFFTFQNYWAAFFELLALVILQIASNLCFLSFYKPAGLLQIPYSLWLVYALYLNLFIAILN